MAQLPNQCFCSVAPEGTGLLASVCATHSNMEKALVTLIFLLFSALAIAQGEDDAYSKGVNKLN